MCLCKCVNTSVVINVNVDHVATCVRATWRAKVRAHVPGWHTEGEQFRTSNIPPEVARSISRKHSLSSFCKTAAVTRRNHQVHLVQHNNSNHSYSKIRKKDLRMNKGALDLLTVGGSSKRLENSNSKTL